MKPRIKSICKKNDFYDDMLGEIKKSTRYKVYDHLVVGELYEFTIDDNGYNLLVNNEEKVGPGFIFFQDKPIWTKYDYHVFFMSKEEMRNINIDEILND